LIRNIASIPFDLTPTFDPIFVGPIPSKERAPAEEGISRIMPDLTGAPSHQQYQQHIPVSLGPNVPTMAYYQNPRQLSGFYGDLSTGGGGIPMSGYDPYAVNTVAPLPMPTAGTAMGGPVGGALPTQHRASSGAWNQEDDQTLLALRAMGKNWNQIQREAFPGKTGNACRKRHERLMERRGQNDFDNRKLERLCKEYMSMRKEIWQPLASRCGEKWNVVEMQVCFFALSISPVPIRSN
jgi:hypothetical protein